GGGGAEGRAVYGASLHGLGPHPPVGRADRSDRAGLQRAAVAARVPLALSEPESGSAKTATGARSAHDRERGARRLRLGRLCHQRLDLVVPEVRLDPRVARVCEARVNEERLRLEVVELDVGEIPVAPSLLSELDAEVGVLITALDVDRAESADLLEHPSLDQHAP